MAMGTLPPPPDFSKVIILNMQTSTCTHEAFKNVLLMSGYYSIINYYHYYEHNYYVHILAILVLFGLKKPIYNKLLSRDVEEKLLKIILHTRKLKYYWLDSKSHFSHNTQDHFHSF